MADALRKKHSVRKGYREVLTKRLGEANVLLEGIVTDREVDPVKRGQLKLFVNEKLLVLKKLDEEIIDLIDGDEEIVQEISETDQYNENAYNSLAKIETYLADKVRKVPSASVHASDVSSKTRLPKLVFKGDVVKAILETKEGEEVLLSLLTTPLICEPITYSSIGQSIWKYPHLQGIDLADPAVEVETIEFDVLIGLDHYWDIITGETIRGTSGPTAVYSKLGWILSGPTLRESTSLMTHVLTTGVRAIENKSRLDDQLKSFWNLESLGILEEATLFEQFKEQVTFKIRFKLESLERVTEENERQSLVVR